MANWFYVQNLGTSRPESWSNVGPGQPGGDGLPGPTDSARIGIGPDPAACLVDAPLDVADIYSDKPGPITIREDLTVNKLHGPPNSGGVVFNISTGKKITVRQEIDAQGYDNNITINGPGKVVLENPGGAFSFVDAARNDSIVIENLEILEGLTVNYSFGFNNRVMKITNWKIDPGVILNFNGNASTAFIEAAALDWKGFKDKRITVSNSVGFRLKITGTNQAVFYVNMDHLNASPGNKIYNFGGANNLNNTNIIFRPVPHERLFIRNKVKELLSGITFNAKTVDYYPSRFVPWWLIELPAIAGYLLQEPADNQGSAPRGYYRELNLAVQITTHAHLLENPQDGENTEDILDFLAFEVEQRLSEDSTLGDLVDDCLLTNSAISVDTSGEKPFAAIVLTFTIKYFTYRPIEKWLEWFALAKTGIDFNRDSVSEIDAEINLQT